MNGVNLFSMRIWSGLVLPVGSLLVELIKGVRLGLESAILKYVFSVNIFKSPNILYDLTMFPNVKTN